MLDIMDAAKNAIEAYNSKLRTTSANIANMAVTGYKRLDVSFQEIFNRLISSGTAPSPFGEIGGTNPVQTGGGATIANMQVDFSQGDLGDGQHLDLAIVGTGLFIASPDGGNTFYYTRSGDLQISNGNLVTSTGMQVYGFNAAGSLVPITGLTDTNNLSWTKSGELATFTDTTNWDDNTATSLGYRIALTYFNNPGGLEYVDGTSFKETAASGSPATAVLPGTSTAAGTISPRKLEQSNVFYIGETIDALEIQRAMSGSLTVVKMISDAISSFINRIS